MSENNSISVRGVSAIILRQEALLLQRDFATRFVNQNPVNWFTNRLAIDE